MAKLFLHSGMETEFSWRRKFGWWTRRHTTRSRVIWYWNVEDFFGFDMPVALWQVSETLILLTWMRPLIMRDENAFDGCIEKEIISLTVLQDNL